MENKFLFIREGESDGTLLAEDGGVATIWHNGEHLVGQCYRERLHAKDLEKSFAHAFEKMINDSSNSAMFDFEDGHDIILPPHIEEMADWLIAGREGEFLENLVYLEEKKMTRKEIEAQVKSFLSEVNEYYVDYKDEEENNWRFLTVTIVEKPKKYAKKILVHSENLLADILVFKKDLT